MLAGLMPCNECPAPGSGGRREEQVEAGGVGGAAGWKALAALLPPAGAAGWGAVWGWQKADGSRSSSNSPQDTGPGQTVTFPRISQVDRP